MAIPRYALPVSAPLLVSSLINLRYLTGVSMTAGFLLLTGKKKLLFVDDRYTEKAFEGVKRSKGNKGIKGSISILHLDELPKHMKQLKRVRFEAEDVTIARLQRWKKRFRGTLFMPSEGTMEKLRRKKGRLELQSMEKACRITDRVLRALPRMLRTGSTDPTPPKGLRGAGKLRAPTTEKELAWEIEKLARELGAEEMAFPTIVAFGSHTSRPHHSPTKKRLKRGDIVQIDMGVKVDGYCSDCSRVFFTAKPNDEQNKVFNLLVNVVKECTKRAKAGTSNRELDRFARTMMRRASEKRLTNNEKRFDQLFLHSLGHGVGLDIHEGVSLSLKARSYKLLPNEVITIEPGVYFPEKWGMRIEDTIVITGRGGRRMTKVRY